MRGSGFNLAGCRTSLCRAKTFVLAAGGIENSAHSAGVPVATPQRRGQWTTMWSGAISWNTRMRAAGACIFA